MNTECRYVLPAGTTEVWKQRIYALTGQFSVAAVLDNNNAGHLGVHHQYELLAGLGEKMSLTSASGDFFVELQQHTGKWLLGFFGYDLKNGIEKLHSDHFDGIQFPEGYFFEPELLLHIRGEVLTICAGDPAAVYALLSETAVPEMSPAVFSGTIHTRMGEEEYLEKVETIRQHIAEGDVYELNLCREFYAENATLDPLAAYLKLRALSPNPFGAFLKTGDKFLLCASPERFLSKKGSTLISQPIKGTAGRGATAGEDILKKQRLLQSEKERAENVMIVDLVRNDLSRTCKAGSVRVDELFGIYSFPQVHQMISTVSGRLREDFTWSDAVKNAFPMGSMTGAPKVKAMELIERYENTRRGLYSGAVGYIDPAGDLDLNVVIRSILYNSTDRYLSFQVGGAITYDSDPREELEECRLKASAMLAVLKG